MRYASWTTRSLTGLLLCNLWSFQSVSAQDCSVENPCETGCCSEHGYCGIGDEYCGDTCVANCDFKTECDANNPCKEDACCSKSGYCGLGPDFCAPLNCVSNCEAKAQCDPSDFGSFANSDHCPLNVCCSRFGFCGVTDEFCVGKKVRRPSCDISYENPTPRRIIGYYEGWATGRTCNDFWPEQIPAGHYTHLIYSFATIDPVTFEVHPASTEEIPVIKRLSELKEYDPDLNVYIAIGGWSYNDPGPTQTTFSDLTASEDAQKKFFRSLISFLSTYDLDGVDIDWEYPGPHDITERGGREEDFENFPKFLKNLKEALEGTGRNGLSITLPASYWYLQYFDIINLEKHVDWFNIMSYDLHGAWDKGNRWTGNFLNAHTNLTEIKDALDLLWRNDINPENVVMGLGFYGRAFTASSIACLEPGCTFESAANKGLCSRENGILLYSEIVDFIDEHNLTPNHYEKEAVKVIHWSDQWVAYDDRETLEQKIKFALGQCLGGIMVWAVSHDTAEAELSKGLGMITGRQGKSLVTIGESDYMQVRKYIDQCKWTNCGKTCWAGWAPVLRDDKWGKEGDLMLDGTGCLDGEGVHTLCCPKKEMPSCGWYSHHNGRCEFECPSGYVEIGSYRGECEKNYQAACCTTHKRDEKTIRSMELWDTCTWAGTPSSCDDICPPLEKWELMSSPDGSGDVGCKDDRKRKYCCDNTYTDKQWGNCKWEPHWGQFVQDKDNPQYCATACPDNKYRISMNNTDECEKIEGSSAYCCDNDFFDTITEEKPEVTKLKESISEFVENPICLAEWHDSDPLTDLEKRANSDIVRAGRMFVRTLQRILKASYYTFEIQKDIVHFNDAVKNEAPNLVMPEFKEFLVTNYSNFWAADKLALSEAVACDLQRWNDLASDNPVLSCPFDECNDTGRGCSEVQADPGEPCQDLSARDPDERAVNGAIRWTCIRPNGMQPNANGEETDPDRYNIHSSTYPTAGDWDPDDEARTRGVMLWNHQDCVNPDVRRVYVSPDGTVNGRPIGGHSEHPTELNTVPTFLNDVARGQLSDRPQDANAFPPFPRGFLSRQWMTGNSIDLTRFPLPPGGMRTTVPYIRLYEALGSGRNTDCFFIVQAAINYAKSEAWRWRAGILLPEDIMRDFVDSNSAWRALHQIRLVFAAFRYMDGEEVRECIIGTANEFRTQLRIINRAYNVQNPTERFDARPVWDQWIRYHFQQMVRNAQERVNYWLDELETRWRAQTSTLAQRVMADIQSLRQQVDNRIRMRLDDLAEDLPEDDATD